MSLNARLVKKLLNENLAKMKFVNICNEMDIKNCEVDLIV